MTKYLEMKKCIISYLNRKNRVTFFIVPVKDNKGYPINCLHSNVSTMFCIYPFSSDSNTD